MKNNVGQMVRDTSSSFLSLVGGWLNDRYKEVRRRLNILDNSRMDYSFSTTQGTEDYVMPDDFGKELSVVDKTNKKELSRIATQDWINNYHNALDEQGEIDKYIIFDSPVKVQPSSAGTFTVVSSSASDTTQTLYARFINANGKEDYETLTLNGTTTVTSTKSAVRFIGIAKNGATAGDITIARGSDTVAILGREQFESRYKIMRLIKVPNAVVTIEINYLQKSMPLNNDYDYPLIDCSEVIEAGATADAWRYKRQFSKAQDQERIFEKLLANLIWDFENQPNMVHRFNPQPFNRDLLV